MRVGCQFTRTLMRGVLKRCTSSPRTSTRMTTARLKGPSHPPRSVHCSYSRKFTHSRFSCPYSCSRAFSPTRNAAHRVRGCMFFCSVGEIRAILTLLAPLRVLYCSDAVPGQVEGGAKASRVFFFGDGCARRRRQRWMRRTCGKKAES